MISDAEAQCPIQTKLVQKELLSPDQLKWLNDYHTEVLDKVIPVLESLAPRAEPKSRWQVRRAEDDRW